MPRSHGPSKPRASSSSGPTPDVIERLGDKASAKREAEAADVPTVPGSKTPSEDAAEVARIVRELGLPAMLKAAAGGGGKGMRAVARSRWSRR